MLNAHRINKLAGLGTDFPNYPLSWTKLGSLYVALAWQHRNLNNEQSIQAVSAERNKELNLDIPIAFPAIYQDQRMIAQRSCFTIHGLALKPMVEILSTNNTNVADYVIEYSIDFNSRDSLLRELSIMGISAATIFPDLDHLSLDLIRDVQTKEDSFKLQ
jgi:hypothetical protein